MIILNVNTLIRSFPRWMLLLLPVLLMPSIEGWSQESLSSSPALKKLSMEELMNIEVTSVSRRPEKLTESPSAIQVITHEDILRSGATSIPEVLRLATNLHVAQKNSHDWAISARGFNTDLANKLLVLIDGRTVYTPLFSGVFWDRQDYLLEDIERIEVISGPGSTLWGSNAVNGVINIITKSASDTQGLYGEAGVGSMLKYFAGARYGRKIGSNVSLRLYGKYFDRDHAFFAEGKNASDSWNMAQGGFRLDAKQSEKNTITFQGDYYQGDLNLSTGGKSRVDGNNILTRWTRKFSEESNMSLQLYYDRTYLDQPVPESRSDDGAILIAPAGTLKEDLNTLDIDYQHSFLLGKRNHFVWGLGYRRTHDDVENSPSLAFSPPVLNRNLFSGFLQDEIKLLDNFFFTIGTKVERNDYTGFEYSPSAKFQWDIGDRQTLWAAVSRAVRIPSRVDANIRFPTPGLAPLGVDNILVGGENFKAETVIAYELGYRRQIGSAMSVSIATFYNVYDRIRSTSLSPPDPVLGLPFPLYYDNNLEGETYGAEISATYQLFDWWHITGGYSFFNQDIRVKSGKFDFNNAINENADPRHRFSIRCALDLPQNFQFNISLRSIGSFQFNNNVKADTVSSYTELEARLGWTPSRKFEISITGQNLLDNHHLEYVISSPNLTAEIKRSFYIKAVCRLWE